MVVQVSLVARLSHFAITFPQSEHDFHFGMPPHLTIVSLSFDIDHCRHHSSPLAIRFSPHPLLQEAV